MDERMAFLAESAVKYERLSPERRAYLDGVMAGLSMAERKEEHHDGK